MNNISRLQLARTHGIGPVSYRQLIARFGDAANALDALPNLAQRGGGRSIKIASRDAIEREMAAVERCGATYIFSDDCAYPAILSELPSAPIVLIAKGDTALMARKMVAIVGARNASAAACRFARMLGAGLGEAGYVVVSGLARGIDTAAHHGAMAHGTIGVIASGIDVYFPPENRALQDQLAAEHLVLSEYVPGTEPLARQFPHRNRIIAGLALGTVVVEAAPRSGSLVTARLANEAGREVMAVPGSPLDPRAQGCNGLIREGATLIQSASDIIEALGPIDMRMVRQPPRAAYDVLDTADPGDDERSTIVSLLGPVAVAVDELARQSGASVSSLQMILLELELAGRLQHHAAGRVSLIS
ncbi:MAG: DNA-processing protein DprA [Pseudomonadota bacterium]